MTSGRRWSTCANCGRPIFFGQRNNVRQWFHGDPDGWVENRWVNCQESATVAEPEGIGTEMKPMSIEEQLRRADEAIAAGNTRSAEEFIAEIGDDAVSALKIMCWLDDRLTHSDEIASDQSLDWERRTAAQGEAYAFALAHEFVRNALAERRSRPEMRNKP